ncbi:hypothetical protein EMIT0158MI4_20118 [Burkholderia ambifaria]
MCAGRQNSCRPRAPIWPIYVACRRRSSFASACYALSKIWNAMSVLQSDEDDEMQSGEVSGERFN